MEYNSQRSGDMLASMIPFASTGAHAVVPSDLFSFRQSAFNHYQTFQSTARVDAIPWHGFSRPCCHATQQAEVASTSGRENHIRFEDLIETPGLRQPAPNGALQPEDHDNFVRFFRMASPYVEGHRGRIFVLVLPGEVNPHEEPLQLRAFNALNAGGDVFTYPVMSW